MNSEVPHLRADAQENRDRILVAARELFEERGPEVGMREIARRAGVGPATLYRRFPVRRDLVEAVFARESQTCEQIVVDACADPNPWRGFQTMLRTLIIVNARNRGFVEAFLRNDSSREDVVAHRRQLLRRLAGLMHRAREQGAMRTDATLTDLVLVLSTGLALPGPMVATYDGRTEQSGPAAARRYADLLVDAFRKPDARGSGPEGYASTPGGSVNNAARR